MMGQEHIRNIRLVGGIDIAGIADPVTAMREAAIAASGSDARGFTDHRDLIAADICDAYLIAAPNDLHAPILKDVLATDKPILCEKPLATTTADCRELSRLAAGRRAPVWVAMEYRFMPPVQRLLAAVAAGDVGTPRMMAIREHRFPFLDKVGDWNRFSARTGGTLVEKCCHFWDLMRLVLKSDPVRVYASGAMDVNHLDERYDGVTPDIIDNAFVVVDFDSGARGMLDLCMFAEGSAWQEVISVTGDIARADAFVPGPARFTPDAKERAAEFALSDRATKSEHREEIHVDEKILGAGDHHGSTYYQHQRFAEWVRSGAGDADVSFDDGYWSVLVGEAAEQSARTGAAISLKGISQ